MAKVITSRRSTHNSRSLNKLLPASSDAVSSSTGKHGSTPAGAATRCGAGQPLRRPCDLDAEHVYEHVDADGYSGVSPDQKDPEIGSWMVQTGVYIFCGLIVFDQVDCFRIVL